MRILWIFSAALLLCVGLLHAEETVEHGDHQENAAPEGHDGHAEPEDGHHDNVDEPHGEDGGSGEEEHHAVHWSHLGEYGYTRWNEIPGYEICTGESLRQSPVDILSEKAHYDDTLDVIGLIEKNDEEHDHMTLNNNGHSVNIGVPHHVLASGGNLRDVYKVAGVHFHWGSNEAQGSEHTVDATKYPLEMHTVMYDSERFVTLGEAVNEDDGLAVLGTLFEVAEENNTLFDPIVNNLEHITHQGSEPYNIPMLDLTALQAPDQALYYRYLGSLTTPPCAETVVWTVFQNTQKISRYQLDLFRNLLAKDDHDHDAPLVDNWRPVQPIHDRIVTRSFKLASDSVGAKETGSDSKPPPSGASPISFGIATLLTVLGAIAL